MSVLPIGLDGVWKIDYRSQDPCHTFANEAGSGADPLAPETTKTATFTLDTTAPAITVSTPPVGTVFATDDISSIQYTLNDGALGSGVKTQAVTFDGATSTNGAKLDMFFLSNGVHQIVVTTADALGNSSTLTRTFEVRATATSLRSNVARALTLNLIKNKGLANSFDAKLKAAEAAHAKGQHATEWNQLNAFINELQAQRGKGIDAATADRFIAFARDLINRKA